MEDKILAHREVTKKLIKAFYAQQRNSYFNVKLFVCSNQETENDQDNQESGTRIHDADSIHSYVSL